jgi:hypothetical protein
MRILILASYASYAFAVWMFVDAYRRGASQFWYPVIMLPFGAWIYFFAVKIDDFEWSRRLFRPGADLKCATCRYCAALYSDRVKCAYSNPPIMKTRVHVSYCLDYKPKQGS